MLMSRVFISPSKRVVQRAMLMPSLPQKRQAMTQVTQLPCLVRKSRNKYVASVVCVPKYSAINCSCLQRNGFATSASMETTDGEPGNPTESNGTSGSSELEKSNGDAQPSDPGEDPVSKQRKDSGVPSDLNSHPTMSRKQPHQPATAFAESDSEDEEDLSAEELVKLVAEKEKLLKLKHREIEKMQDKLLRSYAEMENVMHRTKREAENSKKFAIQNFAKSLLDVVDNLGRAYFVVKDGFSKAGQAGKDNNDGSNALLKTLLEGVEMTEKQLCEVMKKFGVEKFDPISEPFDPHRHYAVYQIPDADKPPGTVASVLKVGYMLHDRVLRPAEVGVTQAVESGAETSK